MKNTIFIKDLNIIKLSGETLIKELSFKIEDNNKIALIGQEGNGKSTILNAIYNNCIVTDFAVSGSISDLGTVSFIRQSIDEWNEESVITYLLSNNLQSLNDLDYTQLSLFAKNIKKFKLRSDIIESNPLVKQLSGGEKVKLQFLKHLSGPYDLLLLDEPTNDLDMEAVKFIENFIQNSDKKVVFISHDRMLIDSCATHVLHIEMVNRQTKQVNTFFHGNYTEYVTDKFDKYNEAIHKRQNERTSYRKRKDRLNDIRNKAVGAQNSISRSKPYEAARLKSTVKRSKKMLENNEDTLKTTVDTLESSINISIKESKVNNKEFYHLQNYNHYVGERLLIRDVCFTIYGNEKYVITGSNGCGKSTLIKKIVNDLELQGVNYYYMPQVYSDILDFNKTPLEFLQDDCDNSVSIDEMINVLTSLNIEFDEINMKIQSLSEGQKAKVIIAKLCLKEYDILIIDELTRNLSPLTLDEITPLLSSYNGCILAISHDRYFINDVFTKKICIENEKLKFI